MQMIKAEVDQDARQIFVLLDEIDINMSEADWLDTTGAVYSTIEAILKQLGYALADPGVEKPGPGEWTLTVDGGSAPHDS
jgi:hypothetical protein